MQFNGGGHKTVKEMAAQHLAVGETEQLGGISFGFVDGHRQCEQPWGRQHMGSCSMRVPSRVVDHWMPILGRQDPGFDEALRLLGRHR
ncbi:hypothetical protein VR46_43130 [Streptomyces sp. NRRL S-444]|nr:hypothetical protein VR46_43130 [Streptomyces sp. NRRL S-444]